MHIRREQAVLGFWSSFECLSVTFTFHSLYNAALCFPLKPFQAEDSLSTTMQARGTQCYACFLHQCILVVLSDNLSVF